MPIPTLIPVKDFKFGFTTCKDLKDHRLMHVALDDTVLGVHKVTSRTKHPIVSPPIGHSSNGAPPPTRAWEAYYPKGSINPKAPIPGGFGFYISGPPAFAKLLEAGAKEVILSYRMMLDDEWEWAKGGKLPGFFGGVGGLAYGCTGGRQDNRCHCFDVRPMWRPNGVGELYTYLPKTEENRKSLKSVPPRSIENSDFGFSVGRGAFKYSPIAVGNWATIACRIKLNDIGDSNGVLQFWYDGKLVISADGLSFRDSKESIIKGFHFETFFGGHTEDWASPRNQKAWFADITAIII